MTVITESQPSVLFDQEIYGRLLAQIATAVIHSDAECERASAEIDKLLRRGIRHLSPEEERLLELLSLLVERYEDEAIVFPPSPPSRTLQFLMEQNDLQPADLVSIFGADTRASDVVAGKRAISPAQAKALGEYFKVSTIYSLHRKKGDT